MDLSQLTNLLADLNWVQWLLIAGMGYLAGGDKIIPPVVNKLRSLLPQRLPVETKTESLVSLIEKLEAMREQIVQDINGLEIELHRIDKMLGVKRGE